MHFNIILTTQTPASHPIGVAPWNMQRASHVITLDIIILPRELWNGLAASICGGSSRWRRHAWCGKWAEVGQVRVAMSSLYRFGLFARFRVSPKATRFAVNA